MVLLYGQGRQGAFHDDLNEVVGKPWPPTGVLKGNTFVLGADGGLLHWKVTVAHEGHLETIWRHRVMHDVSCALSR